jgi:hypothetical protein
MKRVWFRNRLKIPFSNVFFSTQDREESAQAFAATLTLRVPKVPPNEIASRDFAFYNATATKGSPMPPVIFTPDDEPYLGRVSGVNYSFPSTTIRIPDGYN